MIARQRTNLNRTFAHESDQPVDDEIARRLTTSEQELASATTEFALGLGELGGPAPALFAAAAAMRSATASLGAKDLVASRPRQEAALADLLKARQNLRQILSPCNSSQASATRQYDRRQEQKLRRPPATDKTKEQLAQLEQGLQMLAQEERTFSEEIEAKGGGGPKLDPAEEQPKPERSQPKKSSSDGSSSSSSSKAESKASPTSPAERQRRAAAEAERLRQLAGRDAALSDLARRRMEAAAQAVKGSDQAMRSGHEANAAAQARAAAEQLERLARQVGALKARDLAARLATARDLAQALAKAQRELGEALKTDAGRGTGRDEGFSTESSVLSPVQLDKAEEAATLVDLLQRLRTDAAEEDRELGQALARAAGANPPEEIEATLRQAADALGAGRVPEAERDAEAAAGRLDALAQDLEAARRGFVQPQLDRLLAAEKQAAAVQAALGSVRRESQQAEAERAVTDLARSLEALNPADGPLRQAADTLARAVRLGSGGWVRPELPEGYFTPPVDYTEGVGATIRALQAQIQALILEGVLVDRDGAVPPRYKSLVEDYYRVLSEDLR